MVEMSGGVNTFRKREALKYVERLGFKNPSVKSLNLYFYKVNGFYKPRVDFTTLKTALDKTDIIDMAKQMACMPPGYEKEQQRQKVFTAVADIAKNHRL